jgi:hypothetical protein
MDSLGEFIGPAHQVQTVELHGVAAKGTTKGAHKDSPRVLRERIGASPVAVLGHLGYRLFHQFRCVAGVT